MKSITRFFICGVVIMLLLIFMKSWYLDVYKQDEILPDALNRQVVPKPFRIEQISVRNDITLLLRYTPELSHHLMETIYSFLNIFPQLSVIIVSDTNLKRTILTNLTHLKNQVTVFSLYFDLLRQNPKHCIEHFVNTDYALTVPVGVTPVSEYAVNGMVKTLKYSNVSILSVPMTGNEDCKCLNLELNLLQWTIEYKFNNFPSFICDSVSGDHCHQAVLMHKDVLKRVLQPFLLPFPDGFYIQSTVQKMKVKIFPEVVFRYIDIDVLNYVNLAPFTQLRQSLYQTLKIKKVLRETGLVEWYGCTRNTSRCFGTVVDSLPEYLLSERWTPPCCLNILRETVRHVVNKLKQYNVTFWLEGGSLLGAMRMKDIIPWDYDVDIGMYESDIGKCPLLNALVTNMQGNVTGVLDSEGFVWEKARPAEGKFFRVHASIRNRLHVDIFPFYARDGVMTKDTWFYAHPQDKEFPEHYLQPLTTIEFVGILVPAPNNIRDFLEFKFGKGCVENPQYPHPDKNPFPEELRKLAVTNETRNYDV